MKITYAEWDELDQIFVQDFDKNKSGRISLAELGETPLIFCLWRKFSNSHVIKICLENWRIAKKKYESNMMTYLYTLLIQGDMLTNMGKIMPSEVS